jgi:AbiV family abortive infection protein
MEEPLVSRDVRGDPLKSVIKNCQRLISDAEVLLKKGSAGSALSLAIMAFEEAAKKAGLAIGPASSIEFRKYISMHTDTFAIGPVTPAQYLAMAGQ